MQPRGFGLSERIRYVPTLEQHADDILAVMDAVGMRTATLVGVLTTSGLTALAAARAPERVASLVLFKPIACGPLGPDAEQHGWTIADAAEYVSRWLPALDRWGSGAVIDVYDPVQGTGYNRRLMAMLERCSATPATARQYWEWFVRLDISDVLRAVRSPTRVLYAPTSPEPEAVVRRVAELIPEARLYHLPRTPAGAAIGEAWIPVWLHVEEAATGAQHSPDADRFFGTMLFTDVVGSTELLARIGDAEYRALRATHERHVRLEVEQSGGRLINVTGDGTFSLFDGPTQAVRCADEIRKAAEKLGISVRAGARVGAVAMPNEVLVSQTVRDLVAGSGLAFVERGAHTLKGVPGSWQLHALAAADQPAILPTERSLETPLDHVALRTARIAPRAMRAALRVGNALQRYRARAGTDGV
jgi:class 3 adenylate cyclase/pimeloyl-ACP methyl ester carboxylesterase